MKETGITFIVLLLIFVGGYFTNEFTTEPKVVTKTKTDTVYEVKKEVDTVKKAVVDTQFVRTVDTVIKEDTVYQTDTVRVASDTTEFDEGKLKVRYLFPPANKFKYNWQPNPRETIVKTKEIEIQPRWYESKYLWGTIGIIGGVLIAK